MHHMKNKRIKVESEQIDIKTLNLTRLKTG